MSLNPERERLMDHAARKANWKRWGPYLSERAWGTVREDYSADGDAWNYFPHDHARSRAYRWNEDGLGGFCDEIAAVVAFLVGEGASYITATTVITDGGMMQNSPGL